MFPSTVYPLLRDHYTEFSKANIVVASLSNTLLLIFLFLGPRHFFYDMVVYLFYSS